MLLLVFAVVQAPDAGARLDDRRARRERRDARRVRGRRAAIASPLLRLGLLRSAALVRANVGIMLFVGSFVAFQFIAVLYLQELRGWSALETGLALLVIGMDAVLAPTLTPRLIDRFGTVRVIFAGMATAAVAYALFLPLGADWTYVAMLPTLVLLGVAFSLAYGALTIVATEGVAEEDQGIAGGLVSMSLQFGAAAGLAVATAVNVSATDESLLEGYRAALMVPLVASLVGVLVTLPGLRRREPLELAAESAS